SALLPSAGAGCCQSKIRPDQVEHSRAWRFEPLAWLGLGGGSDATANVGKKFKTCLELRTDPKCPGQRNIDGSRPAGLNIIQRGCACELEQPFGKQADAPARARELD